MANKVFANGREVACKSGSGRTIAAFPDVCFTPPENPATPPGVPVPYPTTSDDCDTSDGTRSVLISGKEAMQKNSSNFKKSSGNEAGCAAKKGIVTSTNTGRMYFCAWSMDVKIEGQNAVRHLDLTTSNHASMPGNTPTWPFIDELATAPGGPCHDEHRNERDACRKHEGEERVDLSKGTKNWTPNQDTRNLQAAYRKWYQSGLWSIPKSQTAAHGRTATQNAQCNDAACRNARQCMLVPYTTTGSPLCCHGQQAHHLVEAHGFAMTRESGFAGFKSLVATKYHPARAPCVCAHGRKSTPGDHFDLHSVQGLAEMRAISAAKRGQEALAWNYGQAREAGVTAMEAVFPHCDSKCIRAQLDNFHKQLGMGTDDNTPLRTHLPGLSDQHGQTRRGLDLMTQLAGRIARRIAPHL